jgi:hypothetical protein
MGQPIRGKADFLIALGEQAESLVFHLQNDGTQNLLTIDKFDNYS